jgi:hypothetical protein
MLALVKVHDADLLLALAGGEPAKPLNSTSTVRKAGRGRCRIADRFGATMTQAIDTRRQRSARPMPATEGKPTPWPCPFLKPSD